MNKTKRLILIDGNSLLSSSFFGSMDSAAWYKGDKDKVREKMMKTSTGQYTNAVLGMTKILLKVFKEQNPEYMAVAWDVNRDTFRRKIFPEYKSHRGDTAEELRSQFPVMRDVLDAMGIAQFRYEGYEADDIIGSLSKKFETQLAVYIMTKDQDALQLVTENTRVWLNTSTAKDKISEFFGDLPKGTYNVPSNYFEFTPETFPFFYKGISPIQIIDLKAVEGDKSDFIPGVSGVGEKAIYPLLNEFKTIENIYEYIENNDEKTIKEFFKELGIKRSPLKNLKEGKDMAFMSKKLATIKCDMEQLQEVTLDSLKVNIEQEKMNEKFKELEFNSLIKDKK